MNSYFRNRHSVMGSSKFSWMFLWFIFGADFSDSENLLPGEKTHCRCLQSHSGTLPTQVKMHTPDLMLGVQLEQPRHLTMQEKAVLARLVPSALSRAGHSGKSKHSSRNRHPTIAPVTGLQTIAEVYFLTRKQCLLRVAFLSLFCLEGYKRACLACVRASPAQLLV